MTISTASQKLIVVPIILVTMFITACQADIADQSDGPENTRLVETQPSVSQPREEPAREVSYLREPIPACTFSVGAGVDPCPVEVPVPLDSGALAHSYGGLPTYTEVMLGYDTPLLVPHVVIRGVILPSSTRCEIYPTEVFSFVDINSSTTGIYWYLCFVEIAVTEYIVGTGPPVLSVEVHPVLLHKDENEDGTIQWWQIQNHVMYPVPEPKDPQTEVAGTYEGKELVLFLGTPITSRVETWAINFGTLAFWFLQKHGDEVRAVSAYFNEADINDLSKLDIPLTELVTEIKKADAERDRITDGRLIVTPDTDGAATASDSNTPQPMIVTDANKLKDLYLASGAVYEGENRTVLPPPPPDGYTPPPTTTVTTTTPPSSTSTTSTTNAETTTTSTTGVSSTTTTTSSTTTTAATGLTLSVSDATATEGETMVFNVSLNKEPLGVQVVVNYQSQPVTATAGTDYTAPSGTFIFGPYDTRKTIRVGIRDDNNTEQTETFQITLSQPYGATITKPVGTGTITDND